MKWNDRIGRRLKLHDLHVLLTVAELGSMSRAAEHLAISQPSISKAVADLEHAVGVRLLDRSSKGVECTAYGRALLRSGFAAFDELREGIKEIEALTDPESGEVRVGCPEAISAGLMASVIDRFSHQYQKTTITVVAADNMAPAFAPLRDHTVDFLVGHVPDFLEGDDVQKEQLYEDRNYIVASSRSIWARRKKIDLADLVEEQWVWSPSMFNWRLAEAFHAEGLPTPRHGVRTYSIHQQLRLLASGHFVGALAGSVLKFNRNQVLFKVLPVHLPARPWPVGIVTLKKRVVSPIVQNFLACVRVQAKEMA